MPDITDDQIVYRGQKCTIAYAKTGSGMMPAIEFLNELSRNMTKTRKVELAGLFKLFELMGETGRVSSPERFKKEKGKIFAFKKNQIRIPAFQEGKVWFLTHGFVKKRMKWPAKEFERAERIRSEQIERSTRTP